MASKSLPAKKRPIQMEDFSDDDDDDDEDVRSEPEQSSSLKRTTGGKGLKRPTGGKGLKRKQKESEDEDEDESDDASVVQKDKKRADLGASVESDDEDDDDDDDEDEDEDDEDEEDEDRPKKKVRANPFIEEMADVDDDEEDEPEEGDDDLEDDFITRNDEAAEAAALQPEIYRALDRRREQEETNVEDIEARLKERYSKQYTASTFRGDIQNVPMQFLLPTGQDPNLWLVKCKPGKEKDIAFNLMRKYFDYQDTDHPLRIKSVIARDNLKGYIYVEARSMADVQTALDKTNNVYLSKIVLVPIDEMVDVLNIKKKEISVKPGSWVRIKRGIYKGDLAQVLEIMENNDVVRVKLIPRIVTKEMQKEIKSGRKKHLRVPQRFFRPKDPELEQKDKPFFRSGQYWQWGNDLFDKNGFLEKDIRMVGIEYENITPSLEELSKFAAAADQGEDQINLETLADMGKTNEQSIQRFQPGDLVTITEGDLINAMGTVKLVDKSNIVLEMRDSALGEIYIEPSKLTKSFQLGDHVRVFRGKYKDQTGMVTQVQGNIVTLFSAANMQQFSVFVKDIQSVGDVAINSQSNMTYKLHDLVMVGTDVVGVVIKVESDQYRILDQNGTIKMIKPQEITQSRDSRRAVATDANNHSVKVGDLVEVISGEHQKRQGTILHIFRSWVFMTNKDLTETGGVFVARNRMLRSATQQQLGMHNGPMGSNGGMGADGFRPPAPVRYNRRDPLLHKKVKILKGPFKGYKGLVKAATEKIARVELETSAKIITVDLADIKPLDAGADMPRIRDERARFAGGMTPMVGSKTPHVFSGAQTPRWGESSARTPAWDSSARTPAWDSSARTPAWDSGARTPAWDMGARTPLPPRDDSYGSGYTPRDKQPTYQSPSEPTPYNSYSQMETPAGWHGSASQSSQPPPSASKQQPSSSSSPSQKSGDWVAVDMEVILSEGPHANQHAQVMGIQSGQCRLRLKSGDTITLATTKVEPAPPVKKDRCTVMMGPLKGLVGTLIGMDGDDAIVKNADGDFKMAPMNAICKLTS